MSTHHYRQDDGRGCMTSMNILPGSVIPLSVEDRCQDLAQKVAALCEETQSLWRDALPDGELVVRLVEASHSLHRAALALGEQALIGVDAVAVGDQAPI